MTKSAADLPRAVIHRRSALPSLTLVLTRLKQAAFVLGAALAAAAIIAVAIGIFEIAGRRFRQAMQGTIEARYAFKRQECWQNGGDATTVRQEFRGPFIVQCLRGGRLLYITEFKHPLDG